MLKTTLFNLQHSYLLNNPMLTFMTVLRISVINLISAITMKIKAMSERRRLDVNAPNEPR